MNLPIKPFSQQTNAVKAGIGLGSMVVSFFAAKMFGLGNGKSAISSVVFTVLVFVAYWQLTKTKTTNDTASGSDTRVAAEQAGKKQREIVESTVFDLEGKKATITADKPYVFPLSDSDVALITKMKNEGKSKADILRALLAKYNWPISF